jgi:hypothetical protein
MHHEPIAEERADASLGAIEELVGDDDVQRWDLFLEAANGDGRRRVWLERLRGARATYP